MTWSRAFAEPFVLADGRTIKTLYEAGQLVLALPKASGQRALGPRDGTPVGCGRRPVRRSAGPRGAAILDRPSRGRLGANPQAPVSRPCRARAPRTLSDLSSPVLRIACDAEGVPEPSQSGRRLQPACPAEIIPMCGWDGLSAQQGHRRCSLV
jgi:hypothetical protein